MPVASIRDLQTRLNRDGVIRMGTKEPVLDKDRNPVIRNGVPVMKPVRLAKWRITTGNKGVLDQLATIYGGKVQPWNSPDHPGHFELFTESPELFVILREESRPVVTNTFFQGGKLFRSCEGPGGMCHHHRLIEKETYIEEDVKCFCQSLPEKEQCKVSTIMQVELAGVTSIGGWKLESHGLIAAETLPATVGLILDHVTNGALCSLRIENVQTKGKPGQPGKHFIIPKIEVRETIAKELVERGGIALGSATRPNLAALESRNSPALTKTDAIERAKEAAFLHGLTKPAAKPVNEELKAKAKAAGLDYMVLLVDCYEAGMIGPAAILEQIEKAMETKTEVVEALIVTETEEKEFNPFAKTSEQEIPS